jgi:hypothetical protein
MAPSTDAVASSVPETVFQELKDQVSCPVVLPSDASYAADRQLWNGAIQRFPAAIVKVAGIHDIKATVLFAKKRE